MPFDRQDSAFPCVPHSPDDTMDGLPNRACDPTMTARSATSPLLRRLDDALPTHAFWDSPIVVGASGGADSTALLVGLAFLARERPGATIVVAHAEHDLRAEASVDRAFVAALAGRLAVRCDIRRLSVRDGLHRGGEGIEARARRLRYRFFEDVARDAGARHVAVAHTADDQAETILHRALRGTGPKGLAGMSATRQLCDGVSLVRPLLGMRREAVRGWLTAWGETWCEDASNRDPRHARNFLRHEILARCAAGPYPAATAALVRLGGHVGRLSRALHSAAEHLLDAHGSRRPDGSIAVRIAPLELLDSFLVAEVFMALWLREGWPQRDMTSAHYESLASMVVNAGEPPRAADFPGGVRAELVGRGWLELQPPHHA
jgi:tRNA(Ile)-lysidine synthase